MAYAAVSVMRSSSSNRSIPNSCGFGCAAASGRRAGYTDGLYVKERIRARRRNAVRLRLNRTISSADAHVGDTLDFETLDDITVNGTLVIPKGGLAFATVTEAQAKRRMARGGKLDINIDYVKLASGEKAALRAVKGGNGGGHTGVMVGGIVATAIFFPPAAPFFLFMHGKDI